MIYYNFKSGCRTIELKFFIINGIKGLTVYTNGHRDITCIYWRNIDELSLILNRIPEIRFANPLCNDSELREA